MTISASGTVSAEPDQALITVGVEGVGRTADEAMRDNNTKMAAVVAAITGFGVADQDMATSGLSLNPRYDRRPESEPRIIGYQVSNRMTITVHDIDRIGEILDGIVSAGANTINSVMFDLSDKSALEREARIVAAQQARAKANDFADALGTEILGIINVSEQGFSRPYMAMDMARSAEASVGEVPISARDVDVRVDVTVVFELSGSIE